MISVPKIAWYAPPPGPTTPTIEELKNSPSRRSRPLDRTVQTRLTSGTMASRNAPYTRQVTNRSVALRPPSTTREVTTTTRVPTSATSGTRTTTLRSVSRPRTTPTTTRAPKTAGGNWRDSGRPTLVGSRSRRTGFVSGARVGVLMRYSENSARRLTIARAKKLTAKVRTNSARPLAMRALTARPLESGKFSAMFAAIVEGLVLLIRLNVTVPAETESTMATARVSPSARPRPSMAPPITPERP